MSSDLIDKIAGKCKQRREKLHQAVRRGREWVAVCGPYEGLLPFIFLDKRNPFGIKPADYTNLDAHELAALHGLLEDDYVSSICLAGKSLGELVRFGTTDVFVWEQEDLDFASVPEMDRARSLSKMCESQSC